MKTELQHEIANAIDYLTSLLFVMEETDKFTSAEVFQSMVDNLRAE